MSLPGMRRLLCALAVCGAGQVLAQAPGTFKCVDPSGRSTYTNIKEEMSGKKCVMVSREVSVVPAQKGGGLPDARPNPPRNDARNNDRRRILEDELNEEQKRLAQAREQLTQQQSLRNGDERNYQRVLDRLKPYAEAVEQHEKNVSQLQRELASIR